MPKPDEGFDIVLLMDSSGSMKKTDPGDYRKEAAKLFVSLMQERDTISIVSFGAAATMLAPLTPGGKKDRSALFSAIGKITSREMTTNITEAIRLGFDVLSKSKRQNRVMLLMSDGQIDLLSKEKDEASAAELAKFLPDVAKAGISIYSVAFSEFSDAGLLRSLSEKTGGTFRYARTDRDIHVVFASIFERMKAPDALALEGDTFLVDKDVKEAVLLINKAPGTATVLFDPSGKRVAQGKIGRDIEWFGSKVFDMITIKDPAVGKWRVKLSSREGNKIFVLTDLKLKTAFVRDNVNKGDKVVLDAWLERDGAIIRNRDVLSQIGFFTELVEPDSARQMMELKPTGKEGVFAIEVQFRKSGEHTLLLNSGGKTFTRTREFKVSAAEPPAPSPSVEQKPLPEPAQDEINWHYILINFALINAAIISVIVIIFLIRKIGSVLAKRRSSSKKETDKEQSPSEKGE
ncbi:MAG TPA: VWA domain-containing protein [Dissulfurispiraceae bacterium]|nr:VWA domain-containing protein [Dissulfurispiraceae bacterium]